MKTTLISILNFFGVALIGFFSPIFYAFWFVTILVVTDTITAIMREGRKDVKNVTSKKAFPLIPKLIFYFLLVIVAHGLGVLENQLPFVKFALIGIGWIEVKSIDENFRGLFGFSFIDKTLHAIKQVNQIKRHKN